MSPLDPQIIDSGFNVIFFLKLTSLLCRMVQRVPGSERIKKSVGLALDEYLNEQWIRNLRHETSREKTSITASGG